MRRLQQELARMHMRFIQQHAGLFPVRLMCRVFGVSPCATMTGARGRRADEVDRINGLLGRIEMVYRRSRQTYGSPKILQALRQHGVRCGRNRTMRFMRQAGLVARRQRCFKRTTQVNSRHRYAPNHLQQRFVATRLNQVWLADVTYIATQAGWLYLAAVLDLHSRRIVGWAMDEQMIDTLTQRA